MAKRDTRKEKYAALKAAGYSTKEARRLRDLSWDKVRQTLEIKAVPIPSEKHTKAARAGVGKKQTGKKRKYDNFGNKIQTGKIEYKEVQYGLTFMYESKYTYILTYNVKHKDGTKEPKYLAWTSEHRLSKKDLIKQVGDHLGDPALESRYSAKVIKSSIAIIAAYYNPGRAKVA